MTTDKADMAVQLLRELVAMCMQKKLVDTLAKAIRMTPQGVYAWSASTPDGKPIIRGRAAKLRLLEIARIRADELVAIAEFALKAIEQIEAEEAQS